MQRYFWKSAPPRQVRSPRKEKRRVVAEHAQTRVAFQAEKSAWLPRGVVMVDVGGLVERLAADVTRVVLLVEPLYVLLGRQAVRPHTANLGLTQAEAEPFAPKKEILAPRLFFWLEYSHPELQGGAKGRSNVAPPAALIAPTAGTLG